MFGILKDGSLLIHSLALFVLPTKTFCMHDMSEMVNLVNDFLSNNSKFWVVQIIRIC